MALLAAALFFALKKPPVPPPAPAPAAPVALSETAFLDSRWGMSRLEVEKANDVILGPLADTSRFYSPRVSGTERHITGFQQTDARYLDRDAVVIYLFYRDRLFAYHVFVQDDDAGELDRRMRDRLEEDYGPEYEPVDDGSSLKMIWHTKRFIVNYRLDGVTAALGVRYRPIEESMVG